MMHRPLFPSVALVLVLAAFPVAADSLDVMTVTATTRGLIRCDDFSTDRIRVLTVTELLGVDGAVLDGKQYLYTGSGNSFACSGRLCGENDASGSLTMTFQVGDPAAPVATGTIRYNGSAAAAACSPELLNLLHPGVPPFFPSGLPNPPGTYEAITPTGPDSGNVSFRFILTSPSAGIGSGTFTATFESTTVAFASMTAKADIEPDKGEFDIKVELTLGASSNGINPLTEVVTLGIGSFSLTIPAGSFRQDKKGRFKFEGSVGGVEVEVQIRPLGAQTFELKAAGEEANLSGVLSPSEIAVTIGNDSGSVIATTERDDGDD